MARTGFNKHDTARDACQLFGPQAHQGYDWWIAFMRKTSAANTESMTNKPRVFISDTLTPALLCTRGFFWL